jgi:protein-L-isoaspartate(D-aspartate) O-methyltransferase
MLTDSYRHKGMRQRLVDELITKGISDKKVLEAINRIPRHFFLENAFENHAYEDKAFPIGNGQTISQPYTVAFQTQCLEIKPNDKVLEIGTGSGYQTTVLLELKADVYSIEYVRELHDKTKYFLATLGYTPKLFCGDGTLGLPQHAPYDKIIVTAGAPSVPESLIDQLTVGGILIIPVGDRDKQTMAKLTKTSNTKLTQETFENFSFVPLIGKKGW